MRPELWQRVSELFDQVLDVDHAQRDAWIAEHCGGDAEIEQALRRMLSADTAAASGDFLGQPISSTDPDFIASIERGENSRFGPYRLLRLLGQGGMGEVHLAERDDGVFEQRVALKLVPHPTPGLIQRFKQERQILARMAHPNIARLYDGGIGEHGVPYFAMEYVEGSPISRYVDEHQLDVTATLRLFLLVCDAVQYAHRNLVVHRDLKPSNIFVAGDGAPKLLDFGVAKVLSTTDVDPAHTATRVFTPDYAAPEQILGQPVTTATDVYSLGVVLYELLTGAKPYSFNRTSAPGDLTEQMDATAPSLSRRAPMDAHRRRQLRGDLDRIVLTMLAREPERRYGTVEALSNDIRRFLDGRPIAARGDSPAYRLRKFVRRNRLAIAATVIVALSLITATAISLRQAHRASLQAERAETVKNFLVSVFNAVDPDENKGDTISARNLLDNGAARVERELASQPTLQAELTDLFGNLYSAVGDTQRAEPLLKRAVALSEKVGDDETLYPRSLIDLAQAERKRGDYAHALEHQRAALEQASAAGLEKIAVDARREIAETLQASGDFAKAEEALRAALKHDQDTFGAESAEVGTDMHDLALLFDEVSRYDESEAAYRTSLSIARKLHGETHTAVASLLNDYGLMMHDKGDLTAAERLEREALTIHTQLEGPDHPQTLETENNLATILDDEGKYDETLKTYRHLLDARQRLFGPAHPEVAVALNNLARTEHAHADYAAAEQHLREAVAIWSASKGADHPDTARGLRNLAAVLRANEHFAEAEQTAQRALAIDRLHYPEASEQIAASLNSLGRTQMLQGKYADALVSFRTALADLHACNSDEHDHAVLSLQGIGETQLSQNDPASALATLIKAEVLARKVYAAGSHQIADVLLPLGRSQHLLGDDAASEKTLREALALRQPVFKAQDQRIAEVQIALAEVLFAQRRGDEAKPLADAAVNSLSPLQTHGAKDLLTRANAIASKK
jgi:serine/threonine-protein kinase